MSETSKGILKRVNHLQEGDSSRDLYDDWSNNYDTHLVEDFGYISPQIAVQALVEQGKTRDVEIIDYGCGTGLIGEELHRQGFESVDGVDISSGMLERARAKAVYRNLVCGDLTAQIALLDAVYDVAICVGSMGAGHVGRSMCQKCYVHLDRVACSSLRSIACISHRKDLNRHSDNWNMPTFGISSGWRNSIT